MELEQRIEGVLARIEAAARVSGRDPSEVKLLAVTKRHGADVVRRAVSAGLRLFGENYVQEARAKIQALGDAPGVAVQWHLIGHLQKNKARLAAGLFDCIQTVDSEPLAEVLDRHARELGRKIPVLCQVNLAGERQKSGIGPEGIGGLVIRVMELAGLDLQGLMLMPPFSPDPEAARPWFRMLRELRDELEARLGLGGVLRELSMGMSHDFDVAVEEGATMVRVGTALFGPREY